MQTEEEARQKSINDISPVVKVLQTQWAENQVTGFQYKGDQATGEPRQVITEV